MPTALADRPTTEPASVFDLPDVAPKRLEASDAGMRMTTAEYDAVETWDESYRFELSDGVLLVSPAPRVGERGPNQRLFALLDAYASTDAGRALDYTINEHDIEIPNGRRRADRVIWCGLGRMPNFKKDVPTIAIEFVSKDRRDHHRDFVEKRREYLRVGVREYWIVDRFRRTLSVCTSPEGDAGRKLFLAGETYRTPLLPGFELPFAVLLAEADRVEPADN